MRKIIIYFIFCGLLSNTVFSQDSVEREPNNSILVSKIVSPDTYEIKQNFDSIWCFHPFSINIYSGLWTPIGSLNDYFNPSFKLGASFSLMVSDNMKIELGLNAIFQNNESDIILEENAIVDSTRKTTGASLGGWLTYSIYMDRNFYIDLLSGVTWETIDTDIEKPNVDPDEKDDELLSVSSIGFSFGTDIWINKFGIHNVGIRILYSYAAYNIDEILISQIGGHSISTSLIYRFPRRKQIFRKYY